MKQSGNRANRAKRRSLSAEAIEVTRIHHPESAARSYMHKTDALRRSNRYKNAVKKKKRNDCRDEKYFSTTCLTAN